MLQRQGTAAHHDADGQDDYGRGALAPIPGSADSGTAGGAGGDTWARGEAAKA